MTLDEAIKHAEKGNTEYLKEHHLLAGWLRELKRHKENQLDGLPVEMILGDLAESEAFLLEGFEDALIGYVERVAGSPIALYSRPACIQLLMNRDGMGYEGAAEFFDFNIVGAYAGEKTPVFATLLDDVCALCPGSARKGDIQLEN